MATDMRVQVWLCGSVPSTPEDCFLKHPAGGVDCGHRNIDVSRIAYKNGVIKVDIATDNHKEPRWVN